ncbi:hypothetical protein SAMN06297144_1539 [Sphingomonas guangdongensis]|uniref:Uncharacterized protein n=1 Tax=Sphingomonas guangdongensis TaxID=1141890 RepID=A0A285QXZ7_9SPHN|nr:hypothetical protein [Sphingomonas guangdongensis]SOB86434.1 hypothetical protein SAMN06297144_1539 [Sphingomonas guangdongensis]
MIGPASSSRLTGVTAVRIEGGGSSRTRAGAAMRGLAGKVAATFSQELDLLGEDRSRQQHRPDIDSYDVNGTARALNRDLGGGAVDEGRLTRSLGEFVTESASLIGARPESRSLGRIDAAIGEAEGEVQGAETIDAALRSIDRTTTLVASDRR